MARVAIKTGHAPETVEGFPADAERSCQGALHLHPGQFRDVTEDELAHIQARGLKVDIIADAPAQSEATAAPKRKRFPKKQSSSS